MKIGNFIRKSEVKDSVKDGLGIVDVSKVVCIRCTKEFMFFQSRHWLGIDDWMSLALHFLLAWAVSLHYTI